MRAGYPASNALKRLKAQLPIQIKKKNADFLIDNNGPKQRTAYRWKVYITSYAMKWFNSSAISSQLSAEKALTDAKQAKKGLSGNCMITD